MSYEIIPPYSVWWNIESTVILLESIPHKCNFILGETNLSTLVDMLIANNLVEDVSNMCKPSKKTGMVVPESITNEDR